MVGAALVLPGTVLLNLTPCSYSLHRSQLLLRNLTTFSEGKIQVFVPRSSIQNICAFDSSQKRIHEEKQAAILHLLYLAASSWSADFYLALSQKLKQVVDFHQASMCRSKAGWREPVQADQPV